MECANIAKALLEASKSMPGLAKGARNEFSKYDYTSSETMLRHARKALADAGLTLSCVNTHLKESDGFVVLSCTYQIVHESGETVTSRRDIPAPHGAKKPIDKAVLGAMTTGLSYFLRDLLLVPRGEDEVENLPDQPIEHGRSPSEPPKDWTASPERQIAPATHTGLGEALQKKGLAWEVVRKKFADKHGRMLPANSAEIPVAAVDKLRDLIKSAPNAKKVDPEDADLSPSQKAKVEEMQGATDGKVKVMKRGDA